MQEMKKRVVKKKEKNGFDIADIVLVSVLLAAGAVLKFAVGSFVSIGGMQLNFVIPMYCLAILLIKPNFRQALIIGLLAGAVCQTFPGTPYLSLISEPAGAVAMSLLIKMPIKIKSFSLTPIIASFISCALSGVVYIFILLTVVKADISSMAAYIPIVAIMATVSALIIQAIYPLMKKVLKK